MMKRFKKLKAQFDDDDEDAVRLTRDEKLELRQLRVETAEI